jgi:prepilin-type N-terminal cleavage/methylation domain-containing protein
MPMRKIVDSSQLTVHRALARRSSAPPCPPLSTVNCQLSTSPRRAFTLTELLVVITIIAVLAGLISIAVTQSMGTAKQTRVKVELDSIDMALKAYKEKYGSYPPSDLTCPTSVPNAALRSHVARAFPRYNQGANGINLYNDLKAAGVDTTNFRPDQALVFWLQGFSPDPLNPFISPGRFQVTAGVAATTNPLSVTPLFQFDPTRLWQVTSVMNGVGSAVISPTSTTTVASYFPQGLVPPASNAAPYLYWEAGSYGTPPTIPTTQAAPTGFNTSTLQIFAQGVAVPYWSDLNGNGSTMTMADVNENWVNFDSYQLISAGSDGLYGGNTLVFRAYPTGTNYDGPPNQADDDNITNFCNKARLGDAKP